MNENNIKQHRIYTTIKKFKKRNTRQKKMKQKTRQNKKIKLN